MHAQKRKRERETERCLENPKHQTAKLFDFVVALLVFGLQFCGTQERHTDDTRESAQSAASLFFFLRVLWVGS